jgi:PAS domain S-box-containing protein
MIHVSSLQMVAQFVNVLACIAVVMTLLHCLRGAGRSSTVISWRLFGALLFASGVCCISIGATSVWPGSWLNGAVSVVAAGFAIGVATRLVLILPQVVTFRDRDQLREAETELRQSKQRFDRALEGSANGLWEWNIDAEQVWFAPRFKELLGYSNEEFLNELASWENALHPADRPSTLNALNNHLNRHDAYDVEYRLRTKSGDYRWFQARGLAIRRPDGRPYLMSGSIQDIHARKQAEHSIHQRDQYLNQKQKMEALGELAGGTAHEFNNLLQAISGQIQFAARSLAPDSKAGQDLGTATELIGQAAGFTRRLLDFSRPQSEDVRPVRPNDIVARLGAVLQPILRDNIELRLRRSKGVGRVLANGTSIQQVLLNLCINARDAMPSGGVLTVRTGRANLHPQDIARYAAAKPGNYAILSVSDTGCGMCEERKSRIFEPFFTSKEPGSGTGLGLAIAYSVVKDHHGIIDVESSPGRGSTFTIWLPVISTASRPKRRNMPAGTGETKSYRGAILYAEDDESTRRSSAENLRKRGYVVIEAADGDDARRLFDKHRQRIDAVLLDVVMPALTGQELFHHIRQLQPGLPVIFCSGYSRRSGKLSVLEHEHTWLLEKPFTTKSLLATVRTAIAASPRHSLTLV